MVRGSIEAIRRVLQGEQLVGTDELFEIVADGVLQMGLFDQRNLCELAHPAPLSL